MESFIRASAEVEREQFNAALDGLHPLTQRVETERGNTFWFLTHPDGSPVEDAPWRAARYVLAHQGPPISGARASLCTAGSVELHRSIVALIETTEFNLFSAWERVTGGLIDHDGPVNTSASMTLSEYAEMRAKANAIIDALDAIEREAVPS